MHGVLSLVIDHVLVMWDRGRIRRFVFSRTFAKRSARNHPLYRIMHSESLGTSPLGPWAETVFMFRLSLQVCKDYAVLTSCELLATLNSYRCAGILTAKCRNFRRIFVHRGLCLW